MRPLKAFAFVLISFLVCEGAGTAAAQQRVNDKDVEQTMKNLSEDVKRFRDQFKKAVAKSPIRKTSREKEARVMADSFSRQTEGMLKYFRSQKQNGGHLEGVLKTAGQLQDLMTELSLGSTVETAWQPVRTSLDKLSEVFDIR